LWVLIFSVTGYYGLFDLGIRSSIVRYVAKYSATGDDDQLNRLVNTATFSYSVIGLVCLLITLTGAYYVDSLFHVPADFLQTARWLFLMVGASVALTFPVGVFGGILEGLQRFYLLNTTSVVSTITRAVLIVVALQRGGGLLSVALVTVSLPFLAGLVNAAVVLRIVPLKFGYRNLDRATLRRIANYSGTTFIIIIATRLRFKTDAMVIGTFLSSAAITYFAIASRLVDYASDVVSSLAQIFVPMSSQSDAAGDADRLRKILIAGNRACALIIFPISASLIILGKSVIASWVGTKYVALSYPVLLILVIPQTLSLAQSASGRILWGMAKHRTWAYVVLAEGLLNLALSILLVRRYGIIGDALGTALPLACSMLFFLPQHICHHLKIRLGTYLRQAYSLPLLLCTPLVAVLLLMRHWFFAHTYLQLALQLGIAWLVYGVGLLWAVWTHRAWNVEELTEEKMADEVTMAMVQEEG
jgi:O-antigen/teichoic acid export membrane protein